MTPNLGANVERVLIGEFVDEAEPSSGPACGRGEVDRSCVLGPYIDGGSSEEAIKPFTVLLKDNRVVTVRGCGLKYLANAGNPSDYGSYAVLAPAAGGEAIVALFRVSEVTGIFSGNMPLPRESA
jgi:hypothetical protein